MVFKKHPIFGQSVEVRRLYVRVTHATQGIPSLVIGKNKYDVGPCRLGFFRSQPGQCCQQQEGGDWPGRKNRAGDNSP